MPGQATFQSAFPYQEEVLSLPVTGLDAAADWYGKHFGMDEVERRDHPWPTVILKRDEVRLGFSVNGEDATQDGAAILVTGIGELREEFESAGVQIGNWRVDVRDGQEWQVFFVAAPDGLCFYFHEPIDST